MGREIKLWEMAVMLILLMVAIAMMGEMFLESTYFPMRDNYRECGKIFLCHPPTPLTNIGE